MTYRGPRSIAALLPPALVKRLHEHLDESARLASIWHQCVQSPLAEHARPGSLRHGSLEVIADSPAWASRLRQHQMELLRQLRQLPGFDELREVRVRVVPPSAKPAARRPAPTRGESRIPRAVRAQLERLAEDVSDPALRAALRRLGKTPAS